MVTLSSAESALKTVYLGVVANQLNLNANPLLGKIKQTTSDVWGREIKKLAPYGINGGIGAGTEDGALPTAGGNKYATFTSTLKNLYGKIELSDKAIRASQNDAGAFVNLLNDEMEGLIKASSYNLGRMLFGNGTGKLAQCSQIVAGKGNEFYVDSVKNLMEGMIIDFYAHDTVKGTTATITRIDRANKKVWTSANVAALTPNTTLYMQTSKGNEITGLGAIFSNSETLYGLTRSENLWLSPYVKSDAGEINDTLIQSAIDFLDEVCGSEINYITCAPQVRRAYQEYLNSYRRNIDITELAGGFKAITYNGVPIVSDRFVDDGTMYILNTNDFVLHQLCDWKWLENEDGKVLHQNAGYPTYSATLVKYADLICDRPNGQAKITGISTTVSNPFQPTVNVTVNNEVNTGETSGEGEGAGEGDGTGEGDGAGA